MMKYRMTYDLHTHTIFSHGKGTIEDNVKAAISKGLEGIAITDHGRDHLFYGIRGDALSKMRAEIERLKPLYPEIEIYLGIEANIYDIGNGTDAKKLEDKYCDFILAGYHYGVTDGYCISNWLYSHGIFKTEARREKLSKKNTEMIVTAIKQNRIKVLTHPGDKAPVDIYQIAKACAERNTVMEISTHHNHLTVEEIKIAATTDVNFIISSDAHQVHRIGTFESGLKRAIEAGLDISRIINVVQLTKEEIEAIEAAKAKEEAEALAAKEEAEAAKAKAEVLVAKEDAEAESEAKMNAEAEAEAEATADIDTGDSLEPDIDTGDSLESEAKMNAEADATADIDTGDGLEPDIDTGDSLESEAKMNVEADANPDTETEDKMGANPDPEAGVKEKLDKSIEIGFEEAKKTLVKAKTEQPKEKTEQKNELKPEPKKGKDDTQITMEI